MQSALQKPMRIYILPANDLELTDSDKSCSAGLSYSSHIQNQICQVTLFRSVSSI